MSSSPPATRKVVLCGAGFIASYIARALASVPHNRIQLTGRSPTRIHEQLLGDIDVPAASLLSPAKADITRPETLAPAFEGASTVISLVGLLNASKEQFELVQHQGARNVAEAAKAVGAKLVQFSAIGADKNSPVEYWRTKALGEEAVRDVLGNDVTIIRPSLVFGPGDGFFSRFARLATVLPFLPVFRGGATRFQPVFAGDLARAVEICTRRHDDKEVEKVVAGTIFEAGGPDVFTYREMMELVLRYSKRRRLILSLPFEVGKMQGTLLEKLPENLFTVTRSQVEQLKYDNVVTPPAPGKISFEELIKCFNTDGVKDVGNLTSVHAILPTYL